jgi:hypothetical protein
MFASRVRGSLRTLQDTRLVRGGLLRDDHSYWQNPANFKTLLGRSCSSLPRRTRPGLVSCSGTQASVHELFDTVTTGAAGSKPAASIPTMPAPLQAASRSVSSKNSPVSAGHRSCCTISFTASAVHVAAAPESNLNAITSADCANAHGTRPLIADSSSWSDTFLQAQPAALLSI